MTNTQKIIDELKEKRVTKIDNFKVPIVVYHRDDALKAISKIDIEHKKEVEEIFDDFKFIIKNSRDKYGCLNYKVFPRDIKKIEQKHTQEK